MRIEERAKSVARLKVSETMSDQQTWTIVKRRMQKRWGITPPNDDAGANWAELADHVRDRALRVGGKLVDVVREVLEETGTTVTEASGILRDDAGRATQRMKSVGGTARSGFDVARSTMEDMADSVRDGFRRRRLQSAI